MRDCRMDRVISELKGELPGPLVICIGALHGNEHQGVDAIQQINNGILDSQIPIRGHFFGLLGNQKALGENKRFLDYDLNRCWKDEHIDSLKLKGCSREEDEELLALHTLIHEISQSADYTNCILVDLHTTSSDKGNFIVVPENEGDHPVIRSLQLPVVIDLDKYLEGTLLQYFHSREFISFAFEGGMIGSNDAVDLHASGIWEVLTASGMIQNHNQTDEDYYQRRLQGLAEGLPGTVRAFYRHWVDEDDGFEMNPGYFNFKAVQEGEELAKDKNGPIVAPRDSMIFMPLYQKAGNDGFFLVDEVTTKL